MFDNNSPSTIYPKTLLIRNEKRGAIWQVYHVDNIKQAEAISTNATKNGFYGISLEDHKPDMEETWPDWRETEGGKIIVENSNI